MIRLLVSILACGIWWIATGVLSLHVFNLQGEYLLNAGWVSCGLYIMLWGFVVGWYDRHVEISATITKE